MAAEHAVGPVADKDKIVSVTIAVADSYLNKFAEVVKRCRKIGLEVQEQLELLGVITGSIIATKIDALARVEGVATVERSRTYTIADPHEE